MSEAPPLVGVRVIDLTRYLAGPFCTQILGDYGAEVIKIEPVENPRGEHTEGGRDDYFFMSTNRSKKSVCLTIKTEAGREVLRRMIDSADVVIDNFRPGVMDALGLGYDALAARNPRLVACSISGFGATGPMAQNPGFDQIAQGMSGLMSVTGTAQSGPMRVGIAICDLLAGIFAANGILLALHARSQSGRGQKVETSLLESIVSILTWSAGIYFETGKTPGPAGNNHPLSSPHGVFEAHDRPFNIACGNNPMWRKLTAILERADLASDTRFSSPGGRVKHRAELNAELNRTLASRDAAQWIQILNDAGIPSGPILSIEEMFALEQTRVREMILTMPHPIAGEFKTTGLAVKLGSTPGRISRPPLAGEHTSAVLRAFGYSDSEIESMKARKIIAIA
jgi:crotonobetainyl-CoA:carnitine CoA-transferase CaiB-like acyl-CoA transferase